MDNPRPTIYRSDEHRLERLAAVGQLVSSVAHELNNPLSAILLFAEDLLAAERNAEETEALTIIAQQARRSRAIVRDLLAYVRSRDAARAPTSVHNLLNQLSRELSPQVAALGAWLKIELPLLDTEVAMDRTGIEQVLVNLIMNAAQATGGGGHVTVRVASEASHVAFEVLDDGPGISAEALPHIFDPFFTTKPSGEGTGLGLSVSRGVVQQHGGTLTAENRSARSGGGAQFVVRLPRSPAVDPPAETQALAPPADLARPSGHRVLIIDDEHAIRRGLSRFFSRAGWAVVEAENADGALARLDQATEPFDVVISDARMPGLPLGEFHAALEARHPEVLKRLVLCSGDLQSPDVAGLIARTDCAVLQKPFEFQALESIIQQWTKEPERLTA